MYRVHLLTTNFLSFHLLGNVLIFPSFFKGNFFRYRNLYYVIFTSILSMLLYFSNSKFLYGFLFYNAYFLLCCRRHGFDPWKRKRQPSPVFLHNKSHGQRSLESYSPRDLERAGYDLVTKQQKLPLFIFFISSQPRDGTQVSLTAGIFFTI